MSSDGANQVISGTARDRAGNTASASATVSIDKTLPMVSIAAPQAGATLRTSPASLSGNVSDLLSGIAAATCNGTAVTPGAGGLVSCGPPLVAGSNTLTIAATDAAGNAATAAVDVTYQPNRPPAGSAGGPYSGRAGEPVSFTATGTDPDNDPVTFTWDFGSGPVVGQTATHTYATAGTYQASLTIADDHGATTNVAAGVTIVPAVQPNRPPVAHAGGPYSADVGQEIAFNGTGSTDPDGDPLIYSWTFGDGATGTGASPGHIFVAAGTYTVTLTVEDGRGGANSASTQAIVNAVGLPPAGRGILDGEVYDDSRGLPLAGAAVMLLTEGGEPLPVPIVATADERGQFTFPVKAGEAVVRITKPGFTTVERVVSIPPNRAVTALDGRLTPLDARVNDVQPALSDVARNTRGDVALALPPGSVAAAVSMRVTPLGPQGLAGRLPLGWSPAAAVDIAPPGIVFQQTAQLSVPNTANLPAGSDVVVALYDPSQHRWTAIASGLVSADGRTIACAADSSGQLAFLIADDPPFTPPQAAAGLPLDGVAAVGFDSADAVTGAVVPRAAPPGDDARATGTIDLRPATPRPSGTVIQAFVTERYDLFDSSRVAPRPFTQDIVLYAKPVPAGRASLEGCPCLGASFPITPSIAFSIQQLERGVVALDVAPPAPETGGSIVGPSGGTASDAAGNFVQVPAGALATETIVEIAAVAPGRTEVAVPAGFEPLGAVQLNLGGQSLSQSATLSIPQPSGLAGNAQVVVAEVISDPRGVRRLRIAGIGHIASGRVALQTTLNGLTFAGVTRGGQYLFLRAQSPLGFVAGTVFATGGTPQSLALVTADTAPFADVTGAAGAYIVAGAVTTPSLITAVAPASTVAAATTLSAVNEIARLDLTLGAIALSVVSTSPAANAVNVPLNSPVVVRFSEPLAAATANTSSIALHASGSPVSGTVTLSPDRRIATFLPSAELQSNAIYTLVLSPALRGESGSGLGPFTPIAFTTVDASKPQVTPGRITADLPDADGQVIIFGTSGTSEPMSGVTAANLRTQETITALASTDGSFRLRLPAAIGDEISVTLRDARSREVTVSITQFDSADGTTGMGRAGGRITGPAGRTGTVRPRALGGAATFKISGLADPAVFPSLPSEFAYADRFTLSFQGGPFNQLRSLSLTESQNRFPPAVATSAPFESAGSLVVPADFLVNGTVKFSAAAEDVGGNRNTASGSTLVVTANPATGSIETSFETAFPAVFLVVPREAVPGQQAGAAAVAPTARVDFDLLSPAGLDPSATVLLTRATELGTDRKLAIVDQFAPVDAGAVRRLHTAGRQLPGAAAAGPYGVVVSSVPLVFVSGQIAGPGLVVAVEGSPFIIEPSGPNARFLIPVPANRPFVLNFIDPATGQIAATASGQAPASGVFTLNQVIGATAAPLSVTAVPDTQSLVDINEPVVFTFSEPIDGRTLAGNILVTDATGIETFGRFGLSTDARRVTFVPNRRWRFGAAYRYTVSARLVAISGARLTQTFSGTFTTFAPRVAGALSAGPLRDVAAGGTTLLAGGASGLTVVDTTRPEAPATLAQVAVAATVGAVALSGTRGLAAFGSETAGGELRLYDLGNPASPALIRSAQLSAPGSPGTPSAIALAAEERALTAVEAAGVLSVGLDTATLGPRYPASGADSASHVAILGNKALVAGASGLTILDLETLTRLGAISTGGNARGVAGLEAFRMDLNGDGTIDATTEIFDLAAVANGQDGTLQLFDISDPASPRLISVVRLAGETNGVVLDAAENLAYVGTGTRGVALVDLAGPIAIQPIDLDRNTVDDRVLGTVLTRASAGRLALNPASGIAYVADGAAGLTVVQVVPPRSRFTQILRDPVVAAAGDEESITETRTAFTTDDGLRVTVNAVVPPQSALFLTIDETPAAGAAPLLSFDDGSASSPIADGTNTVAIRISGDETAAGGRASLRVRDAGGRQIAEVSLRIVPPDVSGLTLESVAVAPALTLTAASPTAQVFVSGRYSDGVVRNITSPSAGTTYESDDLLVATITAGGEVTGHAGGSTRIVARNAGVDGAGRVTVELPLRIVSLDVPQFVTLTEIGQQAALAALGTFSDGSTRSIAADSQTQFESSAPDVATVAAGGQITAVSDGRARVTVRYDDQSSEAEVVVSRRTTPAIAAIALALSEPISVSEHRVSARAVVDGTGSLDRLLVTFTVTGLGQVPAVEGRSDSSGAVTVTLDGLMTPGTGTVIASVVDPSSGARLQDEQPLRVERAAADGEPNDAIDQAAPLPPAARVSGTVGGGDPRDLYRIETFEEGRLFLSVTKTGDGDLRITIRSATGGTEATFDMTGAAAKFEAAVTPGTHYLEASATGGARQFSLSYSFVQNTPVITGLAPSSGPAGTLVTISGSGFSTLAARNRVLFGGALGDVVSASPAQLQVLVPGSGVNGNIELVIGKAVVRGPRFDTGLAGPAPDATSASPDPGSMMADPATGVATSVNRLLVRFRPSATRQQAENAVAQHGGTVIGHLPFDNQFQVRFGTRNLYELEAVRRALAQHPLVTAVTRETLMFFNGPRDSERSVANQGSSSGGRSI